MIPYFQFSLVLIVSLQSVLSTNSEPCESDQIRLHFLSDPLNVVGRASCDLEAAQVVVSLTSETLELDASTSLGKNAQNMNSAITAFKALGLEENEFSTSGLQVHPSYIQLYNKTSNSYTNQFEGYKVRNDLTIVTKKMNLAGKIVDAAVTSGVSIINSISYSPLSTDIEIQKEKLLGEAVENAKKQAEIVLKELNYKVKSIKHVNVLGGIQRMPRRASAPDAAPAPKPTSSPTQIFASSETFQVNVEVSFLIAPQS